MAEARFVPDAALVEFLQGVPADRRFVNVEMDEGRLWLPLDEADPDAVNAGLRAERPFFSPKSVLTPARELVARYGGGGEDPLQAVAETHVAAIGVRGCECRALSYLDAIMFDEPTPEPFYQARRENCTVVGVDCAAPAESCFCDLLGECA
ncbi:MAG: hypothetical protein PVJ27_06685, partial [Candidatus Brocadiaceae bacterium]